jgi:hypothetical protein
MVVALSSEMAPLLHTADLSTTTLIYQITPMGKRDYNWRLMIESNPIEVPVIDLDEQPDPINSYTLWGEDGPPSARH